MMKSTVHLPIVCLLILVAGSLQAADVPTPQQVEFFEKKIRPVLVKHCYECHSAKSDEVGGRLLLDSRAAIMKGGESGPAISLKTPARSLILQAMEFRGGLEMPPDEKLPDDVIADFRRWVAMGAPDPRRPQKTGDQPERRGEDLWSLKPIQSSEPPAVNDKEWPVNEIDRFVLAGLERGKLAPVADANPYALCRRIHFDVIGLPPAPDAVADFLKSYQADAQSAVDALVDRLLASPQYGERWGRHWLDVARYAESNGKSRDVLYPYAWRYRNWVIEAFNFDMPFSRFVTEQIAGDLLEAESASARDSQRIATGLLAIGSKPISGGNLQFDLIDDQIDVVTRGFLGITASCARCHDHKFDPIPTADYYALAGIFNSTKTLYGGGTRRPKSNADKAKVWMVLGDDWQDKVKKVATIEKEAAKIQKQRTAAQKRYDRLKRVTSDDNRAVAAAKQKLDQLSVQLKALQQQQEQMQPEFAMGVGDAPKAADIAILIRGDKGSRGDVVPRGFLSSVSIEDAPQIDTKQSGRLQLAQWIAHPDNPLTSRVAVNRIWHHLFGRGLVETVDNFGTNGTVPSHPELLDWLATRFVESGGSTKQMIRKIVRSRTYRLSTAYDEQADSVDPENRLLWRANRRRLGAEAIRDGLLAAADKLDLTRPETSVVARIGEGEVGRGINEKPLREAFYHRGIYLPILRTAMIPILKTFDFPDPSNLQGRRDITNVPTQSLFFMNNPLVIEMSQALAKQTLEVEGDDQQRIQHVFLSCYGRPPSDREREQSAAFLETAAGKPDVDQPMKNQQLESWTSFCQALMASAEFRYLN